MACGAEETAMQTTQRPSEREISSQTQPPVRTPEETEALLAEIRRNREARMRGRRNVTDSVKALRRLRGGNVLRRFGKR